MITVRDLKFITAYLQGLQGRIARLHTEDLTHLYKQGINKLTIKKHALLHKNDHPQSLTKFFKSAAFKDGDKKILFPYTYKDSVTNIGVLCGGGVEILQLTKLPGIFLGADIEKTAHVCQTEFEALLLRQLGVKDATVLTEPKALKLHNPSLVTLVDSGQLSLPLDEALAYNRLYSSVNVLFLTDPISKHKDKTNINKLIEKNTQPFYKWMTSRIMHDFCFDQDILREDLEAAEITDEELQLIKDNMAAIPHSDMVIEWLDSIDRSCKAIDYLGTKIIQRQVGWFIEGDTQPLTNFGFKVNNVKDVKKTRWANCTVQQNGKDYTVSIPFHKLCGRRSIASVLINYLADMGRMPLLLSRDIPIPGIDWRSIAQGFCDFSLTSKDYTALGVEDFAELYNSLFSNAGRPIPSTQSAFARKGGAVGFWHHESANLWLSKSRLIRALKEVNNSNITELTLDNCFGDEVDKQKMGNLGTFYVFTPDMVAETNGIIAFKLA
jgi:hypothetical protein